MARGEGHQGGGSARADSGRPARRSRIRAGAGHAGRPPEEGGGTRCRRGRKLGRRPGAGHARRVDPSGGTAGRQLPGRRVDPGCGRDRGDEVHERDTGFELCVVGRAREVPLSPSGDAVALCQQHIADAEVRSGSSATPAGCGCPSTRPAVGRSACRRLHADQGAAAAHLNPPPLVDNPTRPPAARRAAARRTRKHSTTWPPPIQINTYCHTSARAPRSPRTPP